MNTSSRNNKLKNLVSKLTTSTVSFNNRRIKTFLLIFPTLLVVGLFLSVIIPSSWTSFYFFNSRNFINKIFAYKGNLLFTILYILLSFSKLIDFKNVSNISHLKRISLLPLPTSLDTTSQKKVVTSWKKILTIQLVKFTLKNVILFINFWIIDHIFIWTGGECHLDASSISKITDAERCRSQNGKWEGGFDISGHFCFLTTVSLIFFYELNEVCRFYDINEYKDFSPFTKGVVFSIATTVYAWCCLLFVTSIFYHTILEKILGLIMGYICTSVVYNIPRLALVR